MEPATQPTGRGDCQQLKDPRKKEDATTVVAVTATASKQAPAASMHPLLLAAACKGNLKELNYLLNRKGTQGQQNMMPSKEFLDLLAVYTSGSSTNGSLATQRPAADVEEGATMQAPSAASLLDGVTTEGHTVLHVVTANGDCDDFVSCADLIYGKDKTFLSKQNDKGDTPLHCAARAGKSRMVSHLIALARGENIVEDLLRKENNRKETALHEAVRIGNHQLVHDLLKADPELASFPNEGSSPMYLAILMKDGKTAQTLYNESKDNDLSYFGPNGQNALHAAVLRGSVLTRKLLGWQKKLATGMDENGSTPLHFAAHLRWQFVPGSVCSLLLKANSAALYQPDSQGLFPIHVTASVGARSNVALFVRSCPSSAGLRDAKGRTFLHVAVEKRKVRIVGYACRNRSLAWILNMQDNDGNTALHLAIQAGSLLMFSPLFGNRKVNLNLANAKGQTPRDIAEYKVPPGFFYNQNSEVRIRGSLRTVGAGIGASRQDHFSESYEDIHGLKADNESKELENMKQVTQNLSIGSVLIATVTFGASFAVPGGFRVDDHTNGGTPTLAGRYAFDAFMLANTLAFIFSSGATLCLLRAGSPTFNRQSRTIYSGIAFYLVDTSVTCLIAAFALGVFVMLSSVAHKTAIAICVMSPPVVLCNKSELWLKWLLLAPAYWVRMGPIWTLYRYTRLAVENTLAGYWPFILIFIWAAYGRSSPISKVEPPAPPPSI